MRVSSDIILAVQSSVVRRAMRVILLSQRNGLIEAPPRCKELTRDADSQSQGCLGREF